MKAIFELFKAIGKLISRKPKPTMSPKEIKGSKKPTAQKEQSKSTEPDKENSTFFTDRVEAGGTDSMRRFYKKHKQRLRNQDQDLDLDGGIDR